MEAGSDEAGSLWDASDLIFTSRLSYAEARAALTAARRPRRLSQKELEDGKRFLDGRFQEMDLVEVTQGIVRSAGDLAEAHGLTGYDAVHLASALAIGADGLVLATWDRTWEGQAERLDSLRLGFPSTEASGSRTATWRFANSQVRDEVEVKGVEPSTSAVRRQSGAIRSPAPMA